MDTIAGDESDSDQTMADGAAKSRKCSWTELKASVNGLRYQVARITSSTARQFVFKNEVCSNMLNYMRVFFLHSMCETSVGHVRYIERLRSSTNNHWGDGAWKPCEDSDEKNIHFHKSAIGMPTDGVRIFPNYRGPIWGPITSFHMHPIDGTMMFTMSGVIYLMYSEYGRALALGGSDRGPEVSRETTQPVHHCNATMSPKRSQLVCHHAGGDLWLAGMMQEIHMTMIAAAGVVTKEPIRLTYACKGNSRLVDDPRQAGMPSYVMQEEFNRYTGYWWQPLQKDDVYRILYEEVDESAVKICSLPSYSNPESETEEFRFPRAGSANARSTLRLLEFTVSPESTESTSAKSRSTKYDTRDKCIDNASAVSNSLPEVSNLRWLDLKKPLEEIFPWCEYIPRIGWTPCGQYAWCQILDRRQQRLELVLIPLSYFSEPFRYDSAPDIESSMSTSSNTRRKECTAPVQVIVSEHSDAWVNVHDILYFLPSESDKSRISFIWASEESGFLHLYLVTAALNGPLSTTDGVENASSYGPNIISKQAITHGNWEIIGKKIWVHEKRGIVFFMGLKETPLERHLYCASYKDYIGQEPILLTNPGYSYNIDMDEMGECVMASYSNVHTQTICSTAAVQHADQKPNTTDTVGHIITGKPLWGVKLVDWEALTITEPREYMDYDKKNLRGQPYPVGHRPAFERRAMRSVRPLRGPRSLDDPMMTESTPADLYTPELYSTRLDGGTGEEVHAMLFRPSGAGPNCPAPTVLHVYGGPGVQTVTNTFKSLRHLRMHMLASRGYCVVCIDSRGSKHRGIKFESSIRCRMGSVELQDQIEVLEWLADKTGCIDLNRVAIHGWSYGGYLSLMGLAHHPSLFKVCVACAPVTSWEMYDTAYTERYMDLPHRNPDGYTNSSVLIHADKFPDEQNRLLLIHGLQDENVHFVHTQQLIEALVRAGKPYRLQVYPNERHSLRHLESSTHYETTLLSFLQDHL